VMKGSIWDANVIAMPADQQKVWIDNFDAATRLSRARGTYLMYVATNDHFFSNRSVIATYDAYAGPKYICWAPNCNHAFTLPGGTTEKAPPLFTEMEPAYFACVLGGNKPPLPKLTPALGAAGGKTLRFRVANSPKDDEPWAYCSPLADPEQKQENRKWEKLAVRKAGKGVFTADLPAAPESFDWVGGITWTLKVGKVVRPMSLSTVLVRHEQGKAEAELK
jgi:hypothetical protein